MYLLNAWGVPARNLPVLAVVEAEVFDRIPVVQERERPLARNGRRITSLLGLPCEAPP